MGQLEMKDSDIRRESIGINYHIHTILDQISTKSAEKDIDAVKNLIRQLKFEMDAFGREDQEYQKGIQDILSRIQSEASAWEREIRKKNGYLSMADRTRILDYIETRHIYEFLTVIIDFCKRNGWIEGYTNYYEFICPHCKKEVVEPEPNPFPAQS
jgi:hypothetical protein